jgi:hypothetical protein
MSPEEWNQGIRNEAQIVNDIEWSHDAQQYVRLSEKKDQLVTFVMTVFAIEIIELLSVLNTQILIPMWNVGVSDLTISHIGQGIMALFTFLGGLWLGKEGIRPRLVALSILVLSLFKEVTFLVLQPWEWGIPGIGILWEGSAAPMWLPLIGWWLVFTLVGFLGASLGEKTKKPN